MQFSKDRGQDDKDMAFETLGLKLRIFRSTSVKHSRLAGTTIFLQRSYTTRMALESSRLAELKHAISAVWDVRKKNLRLSIGQIERNFSSLKMAHFLSFLSCCTFQ